MKLAAAFILTLLPLTAQAQIEFKPKDFAIGVGFFNGEGTAEDSVFVDDPGTQFDLSRVFGTVQWYGLQGVPIANLMGVGVDVGTAHRATGVVYRIWSLNRREIAAGMYAGTDMKIASGGSDDKWAADFDLRLVTGYRLNLGAKYQLQMEIYGLEENSTVAGSVLLTWQ